MRVAEAWRGYAASVEVTITASIWMQGRPNRQQPDWQRPTSNPLKDTCRRRTRLHEDAPAHAPRPPPKPAKTRLNIPSTKCPLFSMERGRLPVDPHLRGSFVLL